MKNWILGLILLISFSYAGCLEKYVERREMPYHLETSEPSEVERVPSLSDASSETELEPPSSETLETLSEEERDQMHIHNMTFEELSMLSTEHVVQSGETLGSIASKYNVGAGLLIKLNNLANPNLIRIGQKLKVIQGPFRIVIHKEAKTLSLYLNDLHIKTYDIAVGKDNSTPEGEFKIMNKSVKPIWTDPYENIQIMPDDPKYPLGTRWMQFAEYGYGIHGTNHPESIKTAASFGCIRMLNPDSEEVYDWVCLNSQVSIVP